MIALGIHINRSEISGMILEFILLCRECSVKLLIALRYQLSALLSEALKTNHLYNIITHIQYKKYALRIVFHLDSSHGGDNLLFICFRKGRTNTQTSTDNNNKFYCKLDGTLSRQNVVRLPRKKSFKLLVTHYIRSEWVFNPKRIHNIGGDSFPAYRTERGKNPFYET